MIIDRVVLVDRPNIADQVTGGTLTFSDGGTVTVGTLSNSGAATVVPFTARSVTSVRFAVTSVSSTTANVGLAELEAWGAAEPANAAPTANAGPDQSVSAGSAVQLNGAGSTDPEGAALTYAWKQAAGTTVTLSGAGAVSPTFTAPTTGGLLTFSLVVSDGKLTSSADTVTVTVVSPSGVNLGRSAGVAVSSSSQNTSTGQTAVKAVDGSAVGFPADYTKEWATVGGKAGSWIQLGWPIPVTLNRVVLYDRPNTSDQITAGTLMFSDGSTLAVGALTNSGAATEVTFAARTVTSVRFTATAVSATTSNIGLAEFEAWGAPAPSTNVARIGGPTVSASSQNAGTGQTAAKAVDGSTLGYPANASMEWATSGGKAGSWIQLTWASPVTLNRVVLYDRPNTADQVTAGTLTFSDGSTVAVGALANTGTATEVNFASRTVTSVRFTASSVSASTSNVGLAEIEAWSSAG